MLSRLSLLFFLVLCILMPSCKNGTSGINNPSLPDSFGDVSDLNIIADSSIWKGPIGDSARLYFERFYPVLPQREAYFNVRFYTPKDVYDKPARKELNNFLILANTEDSNSPTTEMLLKDLKTVATDSVHMVKGHNKWARDQLVLYLSANGEAALMEELKKYKAYITREIEKAELNTLEKDVFGQGDNPALQNRIRDSFGFEMRIPAQFVQAVHEDDFMWLRGDTEKINRNIMISRMPYTSESQMSYEGIKNWRDSVGAKFISTSLVGSYMRVNDKDLPTIFDITEKKGLYTARALGIWDIVNDFLGGPFATYMLLTPDNKDIICIDFFVHAPAKDKRNLMKELKYLLETIEIEG